MTLADSSFTLDWVSVSDMAGELRCGEYRIHVSFSGATESKRDEPASPYDFFLFKGPRMVEEFVEMARPLHPRNILELGVFNGGSVVAYNELLRPQKLVAVDIVPRTLENLDRYVRRPETGGRVRVHLGVNQADHARLARICADDFRGEPLDIVIDDCSHFLHETRESFRALFPRLRPGGLYVIEDWSWAHWGGDFWQVERGGDYFKNKEPVSSLIVELMAMCPSSPGLVERLIVRPASVFVIRGPQHVEPGFDLSRFWLNRGNALPRFRA